MDHRLIEGLMEVIAPLIRTYVDERIAKDVAPLNLKIKDYESRAPQQGEPGLPGKDADPELIASAVAAEVARALPMAVSAIPLPQNGKDADPDAMKSAVIDVVAHILPGEVLAAVSAIEKPKDGKDADQDVIKAEVLDAVLGRLNELVPVEVMTAVGKIEKPKDGKDVDTVEVAAMVAAEVSKAVSAIEKPADGKSVSVDDVRPMLKEMIAALPTPENGKDSDPVEVANLLVALMPVPADGKSVTIDDVRPLLQEMVAALPVPENGKDADPELIRSLVVAEVAKLEPPKDGKDGEPGAPGQGVDIQDLIPTIATQVEMAVVSELEKIALPEGKPGEPGKSLSVEDVLPLLAEMVAALPKAVDGKDGEPGLPGNSVVIDDVRPLLQEMVEALPKPKDADPVEVAALILEDVAKLIPVPADGKSVTLEEIMPLVDEAAARKLPNLFLVNEDGMLVTAYANGETRSIGKVRGEPGVRGASVMDGTIDESGSLILRMSDGRILQTGTVRGESGTDGRDGTKGEPGRDAHEIQILPGIDESKSYIDGIVAYWRGGLIRSVRHTDPIIDGDIVSAGWKVCLRGIAEESEEQVDDGRYIEKTTVYTDGTEFKRRHKTATPIYQGVWKDASYSKGDVVTWAGSSFIAQRDTSDKPETTDAWKLSTKRGRDGKDGKIDRPPPVVKLDPGKR